MAESNTATPLPAPEAGENQPNLKVVSAPESTGRSRGEFNKEVEAELSRASSVFAAAQKPEYAPKLATAGIEASFVTGLVALVLQCGQKSQSAVGCDAASKQATQNQDSAEQELVASLRTIQGAARVKHLPDNPALLDNYLVGERLDASQPLLERNSQALIDKANAERPGAVNTEFIAKVQEQRSAFVNEKTSQDGEEGKAAQDRAERDALLEQIIAGRKKIQYAADTLWPPRQPESVQARSDFKLPANRPYSY